MQRSLEKKREKESHHREDGRDGKRRVMSQITKQGTGRHISMERTQRDSPTHEKTHPVHKVLPI
jgi:hypothetical protein